MQIAHAKVADLVFLQITPDVLDWVDFGGIAGQKFQLDTFLIGFDILANAPAAVGAQPIPDDQQRPLDLLAQGTQEFHELRRPLAMAES